MSQTLENFDGERLKVARENLSLSFAQLSAKTKIKIDSLQAMEAGHCAPFLGATLDRLCAYLQVKPSDLQYRDSVSESVEDRLERIEALLLDLLLKFNYKL